MTDRVPDVGKIREPRHSGQQQAQTPPLDIDPRIAATGGRPDGGGHYIWPGMSDHRS
jgi:hypothetical protein